MAEKVRAYRAILIGNAEFPDAPELRRLLGPANDVAQLRAALTDPVVGMPWDVTDVPLNSTSAEIREALDTFFDQAASHDQLLLYYTGHGVLDQRNELYLCARDTTVERMRSRAVEHSFVNKLMDDCAARTIIVVLDCCFSGSAAVKGADPAAQFAGHGRYVMTSCGQIETAADATGENEPSPFTAHLVAGLRHGAVGEDGHVTVEDVYRYVDTCLRGSGQRPVLKTDERVGHVPLARRPARAEPVDALHKKADSDRPAARHAPETRPVFTDAHGISEHQDVESHFSGVLHVLLPEAVGVLSVHRDDLVAAGRGADATARFTPGSTGAALRRPSRVNSTTTADGGALFTLPQDAGTVMWSAGQLKDLDEARATGSWSSASRPTQGSGTHAVLKSRDPVYRRLAFAVWVALGWLLVSGAAVGGIVWLFRTDPHQLLGNAALVVLFALAVTGGSAVVGHAEMIWIFTHVHSLLRLPELPVTPMLMRGVIDGPHLVTTQNGDTVMLPAKERAVLWSEGLQLAMPLDFYAGRVRSEAPPFDTEGPRPVEVIGLPAPGQWVAIRTPHGILWPGGRAKSCSVDELTEVINTPHAPKIQRAHS
ncbi:caspase family protein [Streptomyces sp. NBC_01236]|uniref:caspase family protein n=1 Tax=Streptomyces sp. NBC_01236 TaxID=2903789 RepID=UPI002E11B20A|nr:caspase family protein [Streptomyces sp. NBC_01236]